MRTKTKKMIRSSILALLLIVIGTLVYRINQPEEDKALTREEKLEDFNYLYAYLKENYIRFNLSERKTGINWLDRKAIYESQIEQTQSDEAYSEQLNFILRDLYNPHMGLVGTEKMNFLYDYYQDLKHAEGQSEENTKAIQESANKSFAFFNEPHVLKRYGLPEVSAYSQKNSPPEVGGEKEVEDSFQSSYETKTVIPNQVAYLKIKTMRFEYDVIREGKKAFKTYFESIKDFDKLIIDLRGCPGGSPSYWTDAIVPLLINDSLTFENLYLQKGKDTFEKTHNDNPKPKPISELPKAVLSTLDEKVLKEGPTHFSVEKFELLAEPVGFRGKVYVLIDEGTYSAAENFAFFSKQTGFATLIGEQTAGDAIGPDLFSLPNSGYVVACSSGFFINEDGTSNAEAGTKPDVSLPNHDLKFGEWDTAIDYVIQDN